MRNGSAVQGLQSPYREVVRAKILLLASQGLGIDRMAGHLDMPHQMFACGAGAFMPSGYLVSKNCRAADDLPTLLPVLWLRSRRWGVNCRVVEPTSDDEAVSRR